LLLQRPMAGKTAALQNRFDVFGVLDWLRSSRRPRQTQTEPGRQQNQGSASQAAHGLPRRTANNQQPLILPDEGRNCSVWCFPFVSFAAFAPLREIFRM